MINQTCRNLVGGLEHVLFSIIYGIILPIDFHIFSEVLKPSTRHILSSSVVESLLILFFFVDLHRETIESLNQSLFVTRSQAQDDAPGLYVLKRSP